MFIRKNKTIFSSLLTLLAILFILPNTQTFASTHNEGRPGTSNPNDIVLPSDANIIDVTKAPYNAKGDGKTDDTAAFQKAINKASSWDGGEIYVPNGTYLVSDTLEYKDPYARIIIQGESENGTVIRLKDYANGFGNSSQPKPVLTAFPDPKDSTGNSFTNGIYNMTFDVGTGNPGAIGVQFMEDNQGGLRDVRIKSSDPHGAGFIGLDLSHMWVGPGMYKNIEIDGFDTGIKVRNREYSQVYQNVTLKNQNIVGVDNVGNILTFNNLKSVNKVPVITNDASSSKTDAWEGQYDENGPVFVPKEDKGWGLVVVDGAQLTGGSKNNVAIDNEGGQLFVQNIHTAGYKASIKNGSDLVEGNKVVQYSSQKTKSLFPTSNSWVSLPDTDTPVVNYESSDKWVNPVDFGADPTGEKDSTKAIQDAIDSGASTIYLPHGNYTISDTIHVGRNVKMITGLDSMITVSDAFSKSGKPMFEIDKGNPNTVVLERMFVGWSDSLNYTFIQDNSPQTLILRNIDVGPVIQSYGNNPSAGKLFVEDVCGTNWNINHQQVWMRQINPEWGNPHILNDGGQLWILGLKVEGDGTVTKTIHGGKTEVLGGLLYPAWPAWASNGNVSVSQPAFVNEDSAFSAVLGESYYPSWSATYNTVVQDTQNGISKSIRPDQLVPRGDGFFLQYTSSPFK